MYYQRLESDTHLHFIYCGCDICQLDIDIGEPLRLQYIRSLTALNAPIRRCLRGYKPGGFLKSDPLGTGASFKTSKPPNDHRPDFWCSPDVRLPEGWSVAVLDTARSGKPKPRLKIALKRLSHFRTVEGISREVASLKRLKNG